MDKVNLRDRNTSYFHARTKARSHVSSLKMLRTTYGEWYSDNHVLLKDAVDFLRISTLMTWYQVVLILLKEVFPLEQ